MGSSSLHRAARWQAVRSCLMLAVQADGQSLITVEGLSANGQLHPIQEAFREARGLQCGFCTPGFIMLTYEVLHEKPNAMDEEIRNSLGGNLCRCTGYQSVLELVRLAATRLQSAGATK